MKKVSNVIPEKSNKMYEEFISTRVLNDKDIIDFIQVNNFTKEDIYNNLEKFYQYYISKDVSLDLNHKPKLSLNNGEVNITYTETEQYKQYRLASQLGNKIKTEYIADRILTYCFENLSKTKEKGLLARELIRACNDILENNKINRRKLGELVFGNSNNLNILNSIIHPEIRRRILEEIDKNNDQEFIFIDVALLFEAKFDDLVDKIIVVYVDKNTQLTRLMKRNSISEKEAVSRIVSQMSPLEKAKLGDYTINNNLDVINTYEQVDKVLSELKKGCCK